MKNNFKSNLLKAILAIAITVVVFSTTSTKPVAAVSKQEKQSTVSNITFQHAAVNDVKHIEYDHDHNPNTPTYDYSPTAFLEGGIWKIWDCGLAGSDVINYTEFQSEYQWAYWKGIVLSPSTSIYAFDNRHVCAPSVIKHDNGALVDIMKGVTGQQSLTEAYLMYYECAPAWIDQEGDPITEGPGFLSSICLAASADGTTWYKYSDIYYSGAGIFIQNSTIPYVTPIITTAALGTCGYGFSHVFGGHQLTNLKLPDSTPNPSCVYGAGQPSAIRLPNGMIRLFYYDDGLLNTYGTSYYYMDSLDGIHFPLPLTAPQPFYFPDYGWGGAGAGIQVQYDNYYGTYIALTAIDKQDGYGPDNKFSYAPATPGWNNYAPGTWSSFKHIGQSISSNLATNGPPTIVSNKYGWVDLTQPVVMFSGEYPETQGICATCWVPNALYRISGYFNVIP